jgi:acyl carrier protein
MSDLTPQIQQAVKNICFKSVSPNDSLITSKILDSINAVDLAVELENEFGISIPFVDINEQHFESVATINNYIKIKLGSL